MLDITPKDLLLIVLSAIAGLAIVGIWARAKLFPGVVRKYIEHVDKNEREYGRALAEDIRKAVGLLGFIICCGIGILAISVGLINIEITIYMNFPSFTGIVHGFCIGAGLAIFMLSGRFLKMAEVSRNERLEQQNQIPNQETISQS